MRDAATDPRQGDVWESATREFRVKLVNHRLDGIVSYVWCVCCDGWRSYDLFPTQRQFGGMAEAATLVKRGDE